MGKLAKSWNQPSVTIFQIWHSAVSVKDLVVYSGLLSFLAVGFGFLSIWVGSSPRKSRLPLLAHCVVLGCYIAAAIFLLAGIKLALIIPEKRRAPDWKTNLQGQQRALLGLPTPAAGRPPRQNLPQALTPKLTPTRPPKHSTPISAPSPSTAAYGSAGTTSGGRQEFSGGHALIGRAVSPFGSAIDDLVDSPQQLHTLLHEFERQAKPQMTPELGFGSHGTPPPFGATATYPSFSLSPGMGLGLTMGSPSPLPMGSSAPIYRPSLQPRGSSASPLRADGRLYYSTAEQIEAVFKRLNTDWSTMEVWIERLREWFAGFLLQPLVGVMHNAHLDVVESAQKLGWSGIQLSPLSSRAGGGESVSSSRKAGTEADDEVVINQMRDQLQQRLRTQPFTQAAETRACLQAVNTYHRLGLLLRGSWPRALLPPTPRGYLPARIEALAEGPCVAEYNWSGGGAWNGRSWTPDLPNDSVLLLYLFAAFLEAPFWEFPLDDANLEASSGHPLYIGVLPSRPAEQCYAILCTRQAAVPKGAVSLVCLGPGTAQTSFLLAVDGSPWLILCNNMALFLTMLTFLQHCKLHAGGSLGGRTLAYLQLDKVLQGTETVFSLQKRRWWGLW